MLDLASRLPNLEYLKTDLILKIGEPTEKEEPITFTKFPCPHCGYVFDIKDFRCSKCNWLA